jgi:hypothetical protein
MENSLMTILETWLNKDDGHTISTRPKFKKGTDDMYLNVSVSANRTTYSSNFRNASTASQLFEDGSAIDLPDGPEFETWLKAKIALLEKEKEMILKEEDYVRNNIDKIMAEQAANP